MEEAKAEGVCRGPQRTRKRLSTLGKPGQPEVRAPAVQRAGLSPKRTVSCNPKQIPRPCRDRSAVGSNAALRTAKLVNKLPRFGKLYPTSSQACLQSRVSWRVFKTHGASGPWPQFGSHRSGVLENSPGISPGPVGAVGREALGGYESCRLWGAQSHGGGGAPEGARRAGLAGLGAPGQLGVLRQVQPSGKGAEKSIQQGEQ